jgi:hypothetical protein
MSCSYGNLREAMPSGQMQACVAFVFEIRVAHYLRVVLDDALDEREIIEEDGAAQTPGYVNPGSCQL